MAVHIGQAKVSALELVGQSRVIDAKLLQNRCVQVVNMDLVCNDVVAQLVSRAVGNARPNAAAG